MLLLPPACNAGALLIELQSHGSLVHDTRHTKLLSFLPRCVLDFCLYDVHLAFARSHHRNNDCTSLHNASMHALGSCTYHRRNAPVVSLGSCLQDSEHTLCTLVSKN